MNYNHSPMLPDAIDRLCDSLTVALCSIDASDQECLNTVARIRLIRAATAIQHAGRMAWEIRDLCTESAIETEIPPVLQDYVLAVTIALTTE